MEVAVGNVTFANDRQKASVSVVKQDDTTKNPLSGGIYGLYAAEDIADVSGNVVVRKDTLIEKATTGTDGNAVYQADLPINHSYYVKELQAPVNYYRNSEDVFSFRFQYTNDKQASVAFTHTFENERVNATIHLVKKDKETGRNTQGDAAFEGAVYGVYARENIIHPDGKTGILYKAGSQVATMTVDKKGDASVVDLYLGKYYVKEAETAHGYVLDGEPRYVDLSYRDQDTPVVTYDEAWQNNRQKVKVTVLKKEKDTERVLAGGIFGLFTREDIKNASGDVLLEADTLIELKTTDENGQITFTADLPVDGNYYVKELYAPDGFCDHQ